MSILSWRVVALGEEVVRFCRIPPPKPHAIVYTDAAASSRIVAALVIDVDDFAVNPEFFSVWAEVSSPEREHTFGRQLIYTASRCLRP